MDVLEDSHHIARKGLETLLLFPHTSLYLFTCVLYNIFYNKPVNVFPWAGMRSVSYSRDGCGNPDLQPVGQPRLATVVWSGGSLVELCPQPVGSETDSTWIELNSVTGYQLGVTSAAFLAWLMKKITHTPAKRLLWEYSGKKMNLFFYSYVCF
jgi:hypothetical protein